MTRTLDLNICLLPDDALNKQSIALSTQLHTSHDGLFVLSAEGPYPHISLFHNRYPSGAVAQLKERVGLIASSLQPFELPFATYSSRARFVFWDTPLTDHLRELQMAVIDQADPLRDPRPTDIAKNHLRDKDLPEVMLENIKLYGYPLVGDAFAPHVTLNRFSDEDRAEAARKSLTEKEMRSMITTLAITTIGPHGTAPEIVETFTIA